MIAVDTNILVYAHREDSSFHEKAFEAVARLAESERLWAIPWPCIHEFLAIVTHPRVYNPPTPLKDALLQVESWMECPSLGLLGESEDHWPVLKRLVEAGKLAGPMIHDARVASICLQNGVSVLWTADRDFSRMEGLIIQNPLLEQ